MVKRLFFAVLLIAMSAFSYAQEIKEVTLVVNGEGVTKEDAINVALRSAIEQAFGVFVSANTTILNDELVKDEIATVSSGNIQKYTELGTSTLPNGQYSTTLQATVSIKKLVKYAQNKGSECEFAGATFGANIKMLQLRYDNAKKALSHLREYTKIVGSHIFNYEIIVGNPRTYRGKALVPVTIKYVPNDMTKEYFKTVWNTLDVTSFDSKETQTLYGIDAQKYSFYSLGRLGSDYHPYISVFDKIFDYNFGSAKKGFPCAIEYQRDSWGRSTSETDYSLMDVFEKYVINGFVIKDNNGEKLQVPIVSGTTEIRDSHLNSYKSNVFLDNLVAYQKAFKGKKGGSIEFTLEISVDELSNISKFIIEPKQ